MSREGETPQSRPLTLGPNEEWLEKIHDVLTDIRDRLPAGQATGPTVNIEEPKAPPKKQAGRKPTTAVDGR